MPNVRPAGAPPPAPPAQYSRNSFSSRNDPLLVQDAEDLLDAMPIGVPFKRAPAPGLGNLLALRVMRKVVVDQLKELLRAAIDDELLSIAQPHRVKRPRLKRIGHHHRSRREDLVDPHAHMIFERARAFDVVKADL